MSPTPFAVAYEIASLRATLGDADLACQWLERAVGLDGRCRAWAQIDAGFDRVRADARFRALVDVNGAEGA